MKARIPTAKNASATRARSSIRLTRPERESEEDREAGDGS